MTLKSNENLALKHVRLFDVTVKLNILSGAAVVVAGVVVVYYFWSNIFINL